MVWMKVNVGGYKDRDMAVGAVLWGITCTVKGKRTRLWRSWTGKEPGGGERVLMGWRLCSTFHCSPSAVAADAAAAASGGSNKEQSQILQFTMRCNWLICSHRDVNRTCKSKGQPESRWRVRGGNGKRLTHNVTILFRCCHSEDVE